MMTKRFIIDLNGYYIQADKHVNKLPLAANLLNAVDILTLSLNIVFGYESRINLKQSKLYDAFASLGVPTDYCMEAVEHLVDLLDAYIHQTTRLRPHYSQFQYELPNKYTLVIQSPPAKSGYWLDTIEDYYVGSSL